MTRMDTILENYMVLNSLFFLIERNIFQTLIKKQSISKETVNQDHYLKEIVRHLIFADIVVDINDNYYFSEHILTLLEWRELSKVYILYGYKQFFENIWSSNVKKHHEFISEGSFLWTLEENGSFINNFMHDRNLNSLIDLWAGKSQMITKLAENNSQKYFQSIEIDPVSCSIAQKTIQEKSLDNIQVINWNILKIDTIHDIKPVDIVFSSFVMHEFIKPKTLSIIINMISSKLSPKYIVLRELCIPQDLKSMVTKDDDLFYFLHSFIHVLSHQETYVIHEWNSFMEKMWYRNILTKNIFYYSETESIYPFLCYEKI